MTKSSKTKSENDEVLLALADLSGAVGRGFDKVHHELSDVTDRFDKVDRQLFEIRGRLDSIETIILRDHSRRIEALERRVGSAK